MPPIKTRMLGLQPAAPVYRAAKSLSTASERKPRDFGADVHIGAVESDEKLKRLRIPNKICRNLPSAKNYFDSEVGLTTQIKDDPDEDYKKASLLFKRSRSLPGKLRSLLVAECEQKFPGIIWDVGFTSSGDVIVCCNDGIVICDRKLKVHTTLDHIKLAGGTTVMPSGNIVAIDRFNDTVNFYSSDGKFISSFPGGSSPMNIAVNKDNFVAVTDVGDKCVHVYSMEGTLLNTIAQKGRGYELQWPLYVQVSSDNSYLVSDVLQRKVFVFDEHGSYVRVLQLKTYSANMVLRPHGICLGKSDNFFVVDNALDTIELFKPDDGYSYVQTILSSEEGSGIKPKVLSMSEDGYLVVGGMTGVVKLFKFLEPDIKTLAADSEVPSSEAVDVKPTVMDLSQDDTEMVDDKDRIQKTDYKLEYSNQDCVIVID